MGNLLLLLLLLDLTCDASNIIYVVILIAIGGLEQYSEKAIKSRVVTKAYPKIGAQLV